MSKVFQQSRKVDPALLQTAKEIAECYSPSCVFADAQARQNVMNSAIKMLGTGKKFVGPAVTVKMDPGDLVDCLDALKVAGEGDVIVVDAAGETETSIWGGLMSGLCKQKGIAGAVVDGAIRDTDEIRDIGFLIASRAIIPRSTHSPYSGRYEPLAINVPIQCGNVIVYPGDLIVADEIGITVIPLADLEKVLKAAREQADKETKTRRKIQEGKTVDELLAEFGRL
jgi:regulator of RNase E activity RraA